MKGESVKNVQEVKKGSYSVYFPFNDFLLFVMAEDHPMFPSYHPPDLSA